MEDMLTTLTDTLFALCVTLCTVPNCRCPTGKAAKAVAAKLVGLDSDKDNITGGDDTMVVCGKGHLPAGPLVLEPAPPVHAVHSQKGGEEVQ